jgi:glyoxylase-like metal-dependent hydrolase (beta-lactamase superfamily II)
MGHQSEHAQSHRPRKEALNKSMPGNPVVTGFFHEPTFSIVYLIEDPATKAAAIVDPVLDYDEKSGRVSHQSADALLDEIARRGLTVEWILDTHPHADHFSAAVYLKEKLGAPTAIGERIVEVQKLWKQIYNLPDFPADGSQWDKLFADGENFKIGSLDARVMLSPGHTLCSITYVIGDAAFIHDTLFQPDYGSARTDFPGGSAARLYDSIQQILSLPDETRLFTGHDYMPGGRAPAWESTVAEQKKSNKHVGGGCTREHYVQLREARDKTLPMPKLILHALQVNMRGGRLPAPEDNGRSYLKIPIGAL